MLVYILLIVFMLAFDLILTKFELTYYIQHIRFKNDCFQCHFNMLMLALHQSFTFELNLKLTY